MAFRLTCVLLLASFFRKRKTSAARKAKCNFMARWTNPNTWEFKVSAFLLPLPPSALLSPRRAKTSEGFCHRMLAGLESAGSYLMRFPCGSKISRRSDSEACNLVKQYAKQAGCWAGGWVCSLYLRLLFSGWKGYAQDEGRRTKNENRGTNDNCCTHSKLN